MSPITIAITGLGVVFTVLGVLTVITIVSGKICQRWMAPEKVEEERIEEKNKLAAVISAAVASYLSDNPSKAKISSVKKGKPSTNLKPD